MCQITRIIIWSKSPNDEWFYYPRDVEMKERCQKTLFIIYTYIVKISVVVGLNSSLSAQTDSWLWRKFSIEHFGISGLWTWADDWCPCASKPERVWFRPRLCWNPPEAGFAQAAAPALIHLRKTSPLSLWESAISLFMRTCVTKNVHTKCHDKLPGGLARPIYQHCHLLVSTHTEKDAQKYT